MKVLRRVGGKRILAVGLCAALLQWSFPLSLLPQGQRSLTAASVATIAAAASGTTTRVSLTASGGEANSESTVDTQSLSADARFVTFTSFANNLVANDANGRVDVFVRDRQAPTTLLVSATPAGVSGNGFSLQGSISRDGRFVAFRSSSSNLVIDDTNLRQDIFVRDLVLGGTSRVSIGSAGEQSTGDSRDPIISGNGRYVAFASLGNNLVFGGVFGVRDVYLRDRDFGGTERISTAANGGSTDGNTNELPAVSTDGRFVTFTSDASNLVANGGTLVLDKFDVYLRDRLTSTTELISATPTGDRGNQSSRESSISDDGRFVAFTSQATDLVPSAGSGIYLRDRNAGTTSFLVDRGVSPRLSGDGRFLLYGLTDLTTGIPNVYLLELATGTATLVSENTAGTGGNDQSLPGGLTPDGSQVSFGSRASDLVADDTNGVGDVFLFTPGAGQPQDFGTTQPQTFGAGTKSQFSPDPVNLATGSLTIHADDLALPGRVLGFSFTRWYNSADPSSGPLGQGWTHTYNWSLTDAGATVDARRGDGRVDRFTRNPDGSYADPPDVFDTLVKNGDGTFTLTMTNQVRYEFSSAGRLVRIAEPAGNQLVLSYTGNILTSITDTVGRVVTLSYDAQNHLTRLQDPLGRATTYAYDSSGRLAVITDRIGNGAGPAAAHQWRYSYDGATRHVASFTDPDGRVRVTNTYDAQGRVVEQRDGLNQLTTLAYSGGQTVLTDPRGHSTTYTFDSRLRVISQSDLVGANTYTILYTYDASGNRTSVTDRNGNRTDFSYDSRGNVLSKTDPSPDGVAPRPVSSFLYDAKNNLIQITDATGLQTDLTYNNTTNALLSAARRIDATSSAKTTFDYTDAANPGFPTRIVAPRGNVTGTPDPTFSASFMYDAQGNLVRRTDADGAITTFSFDAVGRMTTLVDPDGNAVGGIPAQHTWRVAYDEMDRETSRTDPLGGVMRYGYDGATNRTSLTDRNGNVTTYAYDGAAQLNTVRQRPDPLGSPALAYTTSVIRDPNGNATQITEANGVATNYAYDALDRLVSVTTHPAPTTPLTTSYSLDGNGQPVSRTTGDGVMVSYTYDKLSRLVAVGGPALAITYGYDAVGRRIRMSDATGVTTYQYDGLGRLTQTAAPNGMLGYVYDRDGNRTRLTYPGNQSVNYAYSPGGRVTTVTDWANRVSRYTYQASGLVSTLTYPNAVVASYIYDFAQRLTQLTYRRGTTMASERYTLDAQGNRTSLDDLFGSTPEVAGTMRYDGLERLTSSERHLVSNGASVSNETFTLDPASNIAARTGPPATNSYDGANRMTSDGTRSFVWNGADRLIARGSDSFTYDPLGRMTSSVVAGTNRTYTYDGDGVLRSRTQGSSTTNFLYDPSTPPAPMLVAGTERIVYGLGPLYRVHQNGTYDTFVRDGLGSVRLEVSATGTIANTFDYTAYGKLTSGQQPLLGFAGDLADPSGLIYLRARWYDPGTGRLLTSDAFPGAVQVPVSLNAYAYATANPLNLVDPSGSCPWCIVGGAVIGAVVSLGSYALSVATTPGATWDWKMAAISTGSGAVAGGICGATLGLSCVAANGLAGGLQYLAAPGSKSLLGLGVATATSAFLPLSPILKGKPFQFDPAMSVFNKGHLTWWGRNATNIYTAVFVNTPRAFVASLLSSWESTAVGADVVTDAATAAIGAGTENK